MGLLGGRLGPRASTHRGVGSGFSEATRRSMNTNGAGTRSAVDAERSGALPLCARWAGLKVRYCEAFPELLSSLRATLFVTTYQAGKLVVVRSDAGKLSLCCRSFRRAMGLDVDARRMALVARREVWLLHNAPQVIGSLRTRRTHHDACFVPRRAHVTGDIRGHEIAFGADGIVWLINTRFSCLCHLDGEHSFVPWWKPPFVSELAPEDRCHLNGLAVRDGQPRFVTALGATDTPEGWRDDRITGGVVVDVATSETVLSGLCMPHSPRWHEGALWLLNSGRGQLLRADPDRGRWDVVATLPGYARGLHLLGEYAFVALSQIRETATFAGMPVTRQHRQLVCGVFAVHCPSGRIAARLQFEAPVRELFDVRVLPGVRFPAVVGLESRTVESLFVFPGVTDATARIPRRPRADRSSG